MNMERLHSEQNLKDEAEVLKVANKMHTDITEKDIQIAQYNNLFKPGQTAAQQF